MDGKGGIQAGFKGALQEQTKFFRYYDPSNNFKGAAVPVVESCWSQMQDKVAEAVESGQAKILEKYQVMERLLEVEDVAGSSGDSPAWRPRPAPEENVRAIVEASQRLCKTEYEQALAEIEKENEELSALVVERQKELQELISKEPQIIDRLNKIQQGISPS